jgi:CRISPR-associated protein Csm2
MVDVSFYKDKEKKTLRPTLFSVTAENLAKTMAENTRSNKRTQLRKFYDEVLRLNSLARSNPSDWESILPYVNMIIAKVAYAEGRDLVSAEFAEFIKESVKQIDEKEDLDVFTNLFEAFMGFYKKYRPQE